MQIAEDTVAACSAAFAALNPQEIDLDTIQHAFCLEVCEIDLDTIQRAFCLEVCEIDLDTIQRAFLPGGM
jgi:hypothetical protein